MKINIHKIVVATGLIGLASVSAFAGYWDGWRVTVQSDDYHWRLLHVPTDRPIRLAKQLSKAECVYGRSWGVTDRGIWVDNGCRGVFQIAGRRPGRWHEGWDEKRHEGDRDHAWRDDDYWRNHGGWH